MDINNSTRAAWASGCIQTHAFATRSQSEDPAAQARDLIGNVWHFLRLECGMTPEGATAQIEMALDMARQEYREDKD
ncbi:hypothetical protein AGRO_3702 [Agrobacterium sp. ATCC 31749]|uniref:hypothetical protein n=1 Tax=unclassified Agrobacterium TaxID=2632611 RepID=UPI00020DB75B|nr:MULTISPECIES: hypothetical protein [unclassified Agrobacterium]EGL63633.1 hypothetical protein AGRO_3702 [Agrobacterium sp. ATCC 31749]QKW97059.1 hypothetical protein GSF67_08155 [Agrobacterium sp. CGMCC 11546]